MKRLQPWVFLLCCLFSGAASSQSATGPASRCPQTTEIGPLHLYGLWQAEFEGLPQGATVLFERHPELAGSVRGGVNRDGVKHLVAGDVDAGEFTLEESRDGQHIAATWLGTVMPASCGKEIRGTWNSTTDPRAYRFILRKLPGWQ